METAIASLANELNRTQLIVAGENSTPAKRNNVVVGEVWLAGGQSNMASIMSTYRRTTQADIDSANDPLLRMITVPKVQYDGHKAIGDFTWQTTSPETVSNFSATAYYFAKALRAKLKVPVGIVSCSYGGTPAEAWMSRKALSAAPSLKKILEAYDHHVANVYDDEADYLSQVQKHHLAMKKYNLWKGQKNDPNRSPKRMSRPADVMGPRNVKRPCGLFETMLSRTIPYTIRGTIWYQGENNANSRAGFHYRTVFASLIRHWRAEFDKPEMPFLFVQLASYGPPKGDLWPELRESQKWVDENIPHTGMVVALDGGEIKDIHPHSKHLVGRRLSLLARKIAYGENDLICNGPKLATATVSNGKVELTFSNAGEGIHLKAGGENTFEISGSDGKYFPADATIENEKVILSSSKVADPKYARYGCNSWVVPTLYNSASLPASPFRTDDFPQSTAGNYYLKQLAPKASPSKNLSKNPSTGG